MSAVDTETDIDRLTKQFKQLQERNKMLEKEISALKKSNHDINATEHTQEFWDGIEQKLRTDPYAIKILLKNKEMSVHDTDHRGQTLLMLAAYHGSLEIVQICLNLGADINQKDYPKPIGYERGGAINYASAGGYDHVKQLLLFNQMEANLGNRITKTADTIKKQRGMNENVIREIQRKISTETGQNEFKQILTEIVTSIISQKKIFSDDLLSLCWDFQTDPLRSDLWFCIRETCEQIITNGDKMDWYFMKQCLLKSSVKCTYHI